MDESEKLCKEYLKHIGYKDKDIAYEPDGRVTPDFLVEGGIAVEVRRLNPNEAARRATDREFKDSEIPLWDSITALLKQFGPPSQGASWFVTCEFSSTLTQSKEWEQHWKKLKKEVRRQLEVFKRGATQSNTVLWVEDALKLKIFRASDLHKYFYMIGMVVDDSAGFLISSEVKQNIEFCIYDKQEQFEKLRHKYPVRWLVLVDYIGFVSDPELSQENISFPHHWDKIVLVNPLDPTHVFTIK
jgi:hypothetical protein